MASLEEYLLATYEAPEEIPEESEAQEQLRQRYQITNDGAANWALRKLAQIRRRMAENERLAEMEKLRIDAWLRGEKEKLGRDEAFFLGLLREYHQNILTEDPRRKTIKLPAGQMQMRAQAPEFKRDDEKLLGWLKASNLTEFIKVVESPNWGELKKRVVVADDGTVVDSITGEVVQGVIAESRPYTFTVKTEGEDDNGR